MDTLDIGILREFIADVPNRCLQPDVKKSYVAIAKKLGTTEDTVRNRVDWMYEKGILRGWRLGVNPTLFGYQTDFFFFDNASRREKDEVLKKLKAISGVLWIVDYLGNFAGVLISSKDEETLERKISPVSHVFTSKAFVRVTNQFPLVKSELTITDWNVIRSLMKDPRKSYAEVAEELKISSRMARRRLQSMIEERTFFIFPDLDVKKVEGGIVVTFAIFYSDARAKQEAEQSILSKYWDYFLLALPPERAYGAYNFILPNLPVAEELLEYANGLKGVRNASMRPIIDFINLLDRAFEVEMQQKTTMSQSVE